MDISDTLKNRSFELNFCIDDSNISRNYFIFLKNLKKKMIQREKNYITLNYKNQNFI